MTQLLKEKPPLIILYNLLDLLCNDESNDDVYIINKMIFKKGEFHKYYDTFLENIQPYYHLSKQYYITRKLTYSRFMTIVRHICNANNISYSSRIKYDKSNYEINYYIYKNI